MIFMRPAPRLLLTHPMVQNRQSTDYPTGFIPKQFQVVRKASGYYLMILFQSTETVPDPIPSNVSLGIDAGIDNFMALGKVELIKIPKFLINQLKNKIKG